MVVALSIYLVVGAVLGILWNRAELRRVPSRRLAPSVLGFVLAWPVLAASAGLLAAIWTRIWREAHRNDGQAAPKKTAPEQASFVEDHAAPHPHPHPL